MVGKMKKGAFSLVELLIVLAIACIVMVTIPNVIKNSAKSAKHIPKIDYDCITIGDMLQSCDVYIDGRYYTNCEYNELPRLIEKIKRGEISNDEIKEK